MVQVLTTASLGNPEPQPREFAELTVVPDEIVARALDEWQERGSYLPNDLLSEPAWGILLELLLAEIQGRQVSLSRIRKVSAAPPSTADRWLKALERHGLVVRRVGPLQAEDQVVSLSRRGSSALRSYFHDVVQSGRGNSAKGE
jgi:DNA-binding MarR family transcriptional regulator